MGSPRWGGAMVALLPAGLTFLAVACTSRPERASRELEGQPGGYVTGVQETTGVAFERIVSGANSEFWAPQQVLVADDTVWLRVWNQSSMTMTSEARPPIDFSSEQVVLLGIGAQPDGGSTARIDSVKLAGSTLLVYGTHFELVASCPRVAAAVAPFELVRVGAIAKEARFTVDSVVQECRPE